MSIRSRLQEGGPGSGFHGHAGRPGEVGGSGETGASSERSVKKSKVGWKKHAPSGYKPERKSFGATAPSIKARALAKSKEQSWRRTHAKSTTPSMSHKGPVEVMVKGQVLTFKSMKLAKSYFGTRYNQFKGMIQPR